MAIKYYVNPIKIFEDNIEQVISEVKIKKCNLWSKYDRLDDEFHYLDGYRISYRIFFDGDEDLFSLKPSTYIMQKFSSTNFEIPSNENYGSFTLMFEYTIDQLKDKNNLKEYIKENFEKEFKNYKSMINYVNQEAHSHNDLLDKKIMSLLKKRQERSMFLNSISKKLEIPMKTSEKAPNVKPVVLKRFKRMPPQKPTPSKQECDYFISDYDYENINNIIYMNGTSFEKTAKTFLRNNEEELRDHLLATLNTHYENSTGETFRKIGKTGILIEFNNKAAFIGECKIWYGSKQISKEVQQIINYSTWKDVKSSIIFFNKKNKSFISIVDSIDSWAKENSVSYSKPKKNIWKLKFYRKDTQSQIDIVIHLFDLYVDDNQFDDIRYQ